MNERGKSDNPIVPKKRSNKPRSPGAETVEERGLSEGNADRADMPHTQGWKLGMPSGLERIRQAAAKDKAKRFTALLHHVTPERLRKAFDSLNRKAVPGVDHVTWEQYGERLEENLRDLKDRLHRGAYRAKPSQRAYIPKSDGGRRPLAIAALEDKVAQAALAEVLNAIYEEDFLGFSYGFRKGRDPHQALDALAYGITRKKVNWVLDADIRSYFDTIDHGHLMQFLEHRIGDPRVLRLIRKWLNAGVLEDQELRRSEEGVPQGATLSPLLANIYLHYVLDLWAHAWRQRHARGDMVIVRYADDFVVAFQYQGEAGRFLKELKERLQRFKLELHPDKTRLIEFGRFARRDRQRRGQRKPETFTFLGFRHICSQSRQGKFLLRRHTSRQRLRSKLHQVRAALRRRMHRRLEETGKWLGKVIQGYYNYHGVPTNRRSLDIFRREIAKSWLALLRRRSQRDRTTWDWFVPYLDLWLPVPRYLHPWPDERMHARLTRARSRMR